MQPKLAVSGYRGIWGDTLTPAIAKTFSRAFADFIIARKGKKVIIGRDARPSGEELVKAVAEELSASGIEVTLGGLLPTPTVLFLVRELKFDGAIIVTASHNPPEYNGLKFVTERGMFTTEAEVEEMKAFVSTPSTSTRESGSIVTDLSLGEKHVTHILKHINVALIKSKQFKVVLDPINSAGAILGPKLLQELGCEVTVINGEPNGKFAHMPEPLAENLTGLTDKVKEIGANVGFAQDPDADRLVECDEKGNFVFEEYNISLAIKSVLSNPAYKGTKDIVINISTSSTNEELAKEYGGKTFRTKVGESNVTEEILKRGINIGGEGSGGIIYPTINPCRDSLTGMALILELLAREGKPLSEIVASLPHFEMRKSKYPYSGELAPLFAKMKAAFPDAAANKLDGLRLDFSDGTWINLRPSNTEPIVRLFGEAKTSERIEKLVEDVQKLF